VKTRILRSEDIRRCPRRSLAPDHYNDDGSCKCCGDMGAGRVTGASPCVLDPHETGQHRDHQGFAWGGEES